MSDFVRVAAVSQLADPGRELVEVDDRVLVLLKVDGRLYCLEDVCTHDGGPLSDGPLEGQELACPRHGARFDIRTGAALSMPAVKPTQTHEVKVEGDGIYVLLREPGWTPTAEVVVPQAGDSAPVSDAAPAALYVPPAAPAALPPAYKPLAAQAASAAAGTGAVEQVSAAALPVASPAPSPALTESWPPKELNEDVIREELKKVIDPELFVNIVDLGLVYVVNLHEPVEGQQKIGIEMTMTSPMCPAGPQLIANSKQVLGALPGVSEVEVRIVLDPPWTPDRMTEAARDQLGIF